MKLDKRNKEYVENYPKEIRYYLKNKYGVSFSVDPQYIRYSGSPIPGAVSNSPYIYEVSELTNGGF